MNMKLVRTDFLSTGIFGLLDAEDESVTFFTLEHAYLKQADGVQSLSTNFGPKVPAGQYHCIRGIHQLNGALHPFETFELKDVPGHDNILFHPGNTHDDSHGCILVGLSRKDDLGIYQSRIAFQKLMAMQAGIDDFLLTVQ